MTFNKHNINRNLFLFFAITLAWTWIAGFIPVFLGLTGTPIGTFIFYFGGGAPSVVALFLVFITYPKPAKQDYFARCFSLRRAGLKGFLWPILFFTCIAVVSVTAGKLLLNEVPEMEWLKMIGANPLLLPLMLLLSLVSGPLNEEFGWRGYALDKLFYRFGFVKASILLGIVWTAWHLAWFFTPGQAQYQMLQSSVWEALLYVVFNTLLSVVISYVYILTERSILAAAFTHMMSNFLTSQLLVPFSSRMRAVIFIVSSLFSLAVLIYACTSTKFKQHYASQAENITSEVKS